MRRRSPSNSTPRWSTCASSSRSTRRLVLPARGDARVHRHDRGERDRRRRRQRGERMPGRRRHRARSAPHRHSRPLHRARLARGLPRDGRTRRRRPREAGRAPSDLAPPARPCPRGSRPAPGSGLTIDDVQGRADSRQIPINKVGIKDIFHPVRVQGPLRRRAAHGRELQHVRRPAPQLQGHAHVALRRGAAPARARGLGGFVPPDAARR